MHIEIAANEEIKTENQFSLKNIRSKLLQLHHSSQMTHAASSLSCLEIIYFIFSNYLLNKNNKFILSKGHACSAVYSVLNEFGLISNAEFKTIYKDNSSFGVHLSKACIDRFPQLQFASGSLGHGLSLSAGLAYAARLRSSQENIFCLLSEGDCNEGSTWEAALFASHHQLSNLVCLIDHNKQQAFGSTKDVLDLGSLVQKWQSFGFKVFEVMNGHDLNEIKQSFLNALNSTSTLPKCIILHTVKGNSLSQTDWKSHYLKVSDSMLAGYEIEE